MILRQQWRSQPRNLGGPKYLILGEWHYFVWKNASQSTNWLYFLNILGEHGPFGPLLATPMCDNICLWRSKPRGKRDSTFAKVVYKEDILLTLVPSTAFARLVKQQAKICIKFWEIALLRNTSARQLLLKRLHNKHGTSSIFASCNFAKMMLHMLHIYLISKVHRKSHGLCTNVYKQSSNQALITSFALPNISKLLIPH